MFNAYFVAVVAGNAPWATCAWTATLSLSYALVIVTAPVIGAYVDLRANKKPLLLVTTVGCVLGPAALAMAGPGNLVVAVVCVVVSNFFFCKGCDLIAAFLPELARGRDLGKVSGWGWSLGYLGRLLTLGACLDYVSWAQAAGHEAAQFVPVTMLITAALFALASLPTFAFLRERAPQPARCAEERVTTGLPGLKEAGRRACARVWFRCSAAGTRSRGCARSKAAAAASPPAAPPDRRSSWPR